MRVKFFKTSLSGWNFGLRLLPRSKVGRYGWLAQFMVCKWNLQIVGRQ